MTKGRLLFLCLSVVSLFSLGACASKVDKPQKSETVKSESKSKSEAQEEVISQETSEVELKSTINIEEIAQNNFSSLIGTWTNPTSGQTITVTGEMMNRPEGSSGAASGVILANTAENGYPKVITSGNISNGILYGAIGNYGEGTSKFTPLAIIPGGIKANMPGVPDDSDITLDRLIPGAGQAGFSTEAYYRE
jgi:hypothetical protein